MKQIWTSRRLFIATLAIIASVWRPEVASYAAAIAMMVAGVNGIQSVFTKKTEGKL